MAPVHRRARSGVGMQELPGRACGELSSPIPALPPTCAGRASAREFLRASTRRGADSHRVASHRIASPEHDTKAMQDTTRPEGRAVAPSSSALPPSLPFPRRTPYRAPVGTRMNRMGFGWADGGECEMPWCMKYKRSSAAIFLNLRNETLPVRRPA